MVRSGMRHLPCLRATVIDQRTLSIIYLPAVSNNIFQNIAGQGEVVRSCALVGSRIRSIGLHIVSVNGTMKPLAEVRFFGPVGSLRSGHSLVVTPATRQRLFFEFLPTVQDAFPSAVVYIIRRDVAKGS